MFVAALIAGCNNDPANPITSSIPDTTGNGGGNQNGSPWILEGPVTYAIGVITARNSSDTPGDTVNCRATLAEAKDFGETALVTFRWQEEKLSGGEYSFEVGEDVTELEPIPYHEESAGSMKTQLQFWLDFRANLYSRFEFKLPPNSLVRISNYRSFAGDG